MWEKWIGPMELYLILSLVALTIAWVFIPKKTRSHDMVRPLAISALALNFLISMGLVSFISETKAAAYTKWLFFAYILLVIIYIIREKIKK